MPSRGKKILNLLQKDDVIETKKCCQVVKERKGEIRQINQKSVELVPDSLKLYDEGKWDEFKSSFNSSWKNILSDVKSTKKREKEDKQTHIQSWESLFHIDTNTTVSDELTDFLCDYQDEKHNDPDYIPSDSEESSDGSQDSTGVVSEINVVNNDPPITSVQSSLEILEATPKISPHINQKAPTAQSRIYTELVTGNIIVNTDLPKASTKSSLGVSRVSPKLFPIASTSSALGIPETNSSPVITVAPTNNSCKRRFDKRQCCIYCELLVTNFARHLERKHSNKIEVGKFLALPKKSAKRKELILNLQRKGNFEYNSKILTDQMGSLIVTKRPSKEDMAGNYLPCKFCLGFFVRKKLYRHMKVCTYKTNADPSIKEKSRSNAQSVGSTLLLPLNGASDKLKETVFKIMKNDSISLIVKKDELICEYGSRAIKNHNETHQISVVSQKLREIGRLLQQLQIDLSNPLLTLQSCLQPSMYGTIITCLQKLTGYNETTGLYDKASLATKMGHTLRQCTEILECKAIIRGDSKQKTTAIEFRSLLDKQFKYDVASNAAKTLVKQKMAKPQMLPLARDLSLLNKFITEQEIDLQAVVNDKPSEAHWRMLSEVTLAHVILLNRRRSGEAQRITVQDYVNRDEQSQQEEILKSLSEVEQVLTKSLTRIEIRGKRGRTVPVLLTPVMKTNIDLLLRTRYSANVLPSNTFLFALPGTNNSCLRGSDVLRKFSVRCGATSPSHLTSTRLRKHVATVSQIINLSENDMDQLAKFMGHDTRIHKEYYRLPENTIQLARISKVLLAMEKGQTHLLKGKTLEEINTNLEESGSSESESEDIIPNDDPEPLILEDVKNVEIEEEITSRKRIHTNIPHKSIKRKRASVRVPESLEMVGEKLPEEVQNGVKLQPPVEVEKETTSCKNKHTNIPHESIKKKRASVRVPWSHEESMVVKRVFRRNILLGRVPNKEECVKCLSEEPLLQSRSWSNIKFHVYNLIRKGAT